MDFKPLLQNKDQSCETKGSSCNVQRDTNPPVNVYGIHSLYEGSVKYLFFPSILPSLQSLTQLETPNPSSWDSASCLPCSLFSRKPLFDSSQKEIL